jgi:hypothetical protein
MRQREYFGRVSERHGSFSRRVEGGKEEDKKGD